MVNRRTILFSFLLVPIVAVSQLTDDWPRGSSPVEVGRRVVERFIASPHGVYNAPGTKPHIPYFEVCTWYGALTWTRQTGDTLLCQNLIERFKPLWHRDSSLLPVPDHVDYTVFGALSLEIYLQTKAPEYFRLGKHYADKQWAPPEGPRVIPDSYRFYNMGYTWQTRLWIDDMYMITLLQAQAYRATGDRTYIDKAAREMVFYLDSLQKPNGLFFHAPDTPFFWGRGNGWMAAGMTELLRALPSDSPYRARIMKGYRGMMSSLLKYQSPEGMWRQLVDDSASWPETSATGMFCFAMIVGVKQGWLKENAYQVAANKAWIALTGYINEQADVRDVCEGTGKKNDRQYYLDRKRVTGDFHGQAPVLWCATALLEKGKVKGER